MKHLLRLAMAFALTMANDAYGELSIRRAEYEVTHVQGAFGTYGPISKGDILVFDPNELLQKKPNDDKPKMLKLRPGKDSIGQPYLVLHDFRLERVQSHKGLIIGYSFFSRYGATVGGAQTLLRFDLLVEPKRELNAMFIVYEWEGIIQGTINLKKLEKKRDRAPDAKAQPQD